MKKSLLILTGGLTLAVGPQLHAEEFLPDYRPSVSSETSFPEQDEATRPQGVFVPAQQVAMVTPGLKKSEVYTLLDVPHFHEGLFGVRHWNYLINFYTGEGSKSVQCQYQIQFEHGRVESTYWRYQSCADWLEAALAPPQPRG